MGFMAGFGSAFADSYNRAQERQFEHNEDDFKLQMQAALNRQERLLAIDRDNYKAQMAAKSAAAAIGRPEMWPAFYGQAVGGASVDQMIQWGQNTVFKTTSTPNSTGNSAGSGGMPADDSQNLSHQAQSATDSQMVSSGMAAPQSGGIFNPNPPPPNTGQDQAASHEQQGPDTSNNVNAPAAPMGAQGATAPDHPIPPMPVGPTSPTTSASAQTGSAMQAPDPVQAQQNQPTNAAPQDALPQSAPVPAPKPAPVSAGQTNQMPPPAPDQQFTPPAGGNVPSPNLSATPPKGPMDWSGMNPGSSANAQRVAQDLGPDEYKRVMNTNLITGTPIPGLANAQITMRPRGVMRWQDVKNLNDAQAYLKGVSNDPDLQAEIPKARQMVDTYLQQRLDEARMQGIANGTWRVPTRAAIKDNNGRFTGQFAYSQTDDTGQDVAKDDNGIQIWRTPQGQRVPLQNLRIFGKDVEDRIAADNKVMGPEKDAYNQDKASFFDMLGTMGNMQRLATNYPAAMGKSGDFAQAVNNAKRETFNILSLIHPGLDPEAPVDPNAPVNTDPSALGTMEQYEKKLWGQLGSVNDNTKKTAIAASLLDAQAIRLAYMQAMSMNENAGPNGKRVSQAQFEGIYKAIRSGEQNESLGRSNADFLVSKYNNLKTREKQFQQVGSPISDFQQQFNMPSPLSYGTSIDDDLKGNPQAQQDFNYFRNLPDIPISGKPAPSIMDTARRAVGLPPAPAAGQGFASPEATPNHTVGNSVLPPDIPKGSVPFGLTPDGKKIVYKTPDGQQLISDH